ncbi:nucleoid occlusion protein [Sporosarcina thermotolerans]|uniref:Nucleoid occlusion protein n=1 Tax=Sporosarcina thermotolerans TaxID=633404 RepID=A0AAW9A7Z9_9BACL|nr:nucleoid occlusion protein [Sporosarcina thermotolerans]MDW0116475.1 nucleoid occlusion protein [Sporosarcina thermotolerans]
MKNTFSRFFGSVEKEPEIQQIENTPSEKVEQVKIDLIKPNKYQPRTIFSEEKIEELARTIHTHGVIQPIVIRKSNDGYEIIAGERRYRAMKKLGWEEVPAIIRNLDDRETASIALIENLQREELTAIEEAYAYEKLLELHSLTQEALAQRLGKGQSTIANKLRLLKLPKEIKDKILTKELSERHARALISVKDADLQHKLFNEAIDEQLNVKQLEERIHLALNPVEEEKVKKKPVKRKSVSKDVRIALNTIRQSLALVTKSGINVKTEEEDTDDFYTITVKIPKKK